jgi:hypothetical protein
VTGAPKLRLLSCSLGGRRPVPSLRTLVRSLAPDVLLVRDGPRRLRWRARSAAVADEFGLVVAGGGEPALGNLALVSLRVAVHDTWCVQFPLTPGRLMRGAVLARCSVAGQRFVVAGSRLAPARDERARQAVVLAKVLSEVEEPLVAAADLGEEPGGPSWSTIGDGRVDAGSGSRTGAGSSTIFVDPGVEVRDFRTIAVAGGTSVIMADLTLGASGDAGQMVTGGQSH